MIISTYFFLKKTVILNTYAWEFLQVAKHSKTHKKIILKGGPSSVYKLGVSSGRCAANSFIFCGMCLFRSSRYFFHNFRGLRWIPQKKRLAPNFKTTTLAHFRLSLLLNNHNMAWSFVGKYEQVSTYVSWKIPLYQNYKR